MPYTHFFTYSTAENFLSELLAFATSNGWSEVENTATQIQINKDGVTWKLWKLNSVRIGMSATISGVESPAGIWYGDTIYGGSTYGKVWFIASVNNLIIFAQKMYYDSSQGLLMGGIVRTASKIGNWSGGIYLVGSQSYSSYRHDTTFTGTMPAMGSFFYEGAWTTLGTGAVAGRVFGTRTFENDTIRNPNIFNSAIVPIPLMFCMWDTNVNYYMPLGHVDGAYIFRPGDTYVSGDVLTIGGSDYYYFRETTTIDLLFKIS